jgi:hypothetical protein
MKLVRVGYVDFKVGKKPKFIGKKAGEKPGSLP